MGAERRSECDDGPDLSGLSEEQRDLLRMLAISSNSNLVINGQADPNVTALARLGLLAPCSDQSQPIGFASVWQITRAGRSALSAFDLPDDGLSSGSGIFSDTSGKRSSDVHLRHAVTLPPAD